jgi:4a-hydroxytetrahydrobiopterin dehydratase
MTERITPRQFHAAVGAEDWRVLGEGACTYFRTGSLAAGARLVHAISQLAGLEDHHPDVDLRYGGVTVRLITITHDYYGLTSTRRRGGCWPMPRATRPAWPPG